MARQWLAEGVQVYEDGSEELFLEGVQIVEDQGAGAPGSLVGTSVLAFGSGTSTLSGAGLLAGSAAMVFTASATPALPSGGMAGSAAMAFGHGSSTLSATATITITTPTIYQSRQIDVSDQASIPLTGTYTGSPAAIEASFNGGAYATIAASPAGGTYSGTLANQAAGQGTLTVRFTNNTSITASVTYITLTDVFVLAGDSRASGRLTNAQSYTGAGRMPCFREDDASAHGDPADTGALNGTFAPLIASLYSALKSRPCAFVTVGASGTDLAGASNGWAKPNGNYAQMVTQVTASGAGGVKACLFFLGPNAIYNLGGAEVSQATYNAALDQLVSDIAADLGASVKLFVDICGETVTGSRPATAKNKIRLAVKEAWNDNASILGGPVLIDQDYADGVHPATNAAGLVVSQRTWCAIADAFYSGTFGRGPRVSGPILLDATRKFITITFDRDLASGTTYGGFSVTDSGVPATIVAATRTGTRLVTIEVSSALSAVANVAVSFASGDNAVGLIVPTSIAQTLPDASTVTLPAELFVDSAVTSQSLFGTCALTFGVGTAQLAAGGALTGTAALTFATTGGCFDAAAEVPIGLPYTMEFDLYMIMDHAPRTVAYYRRGVMDEYASPVTIHVYREPIGSRHASMAGAVLPQGSVVYHLPAREISGRVPAPHDRIQDGAQGYTIDSVDNQAARTRYRLTCIPEV